MGISTDNGYTKENLLDYECFPKYYKLIVTNLSK